MLAPQDAEYDQHGAESEGYGSRGPEHDPDQYRERTHINRLVYTC